MTATQIRPAGRLIPLVAGNRTAMDSQAGWAQTAQLVADQMRRHLPTPDVLTASARRTATAATPSTSSPTGPSRSSFWSGGPAR